MACTVRVPMSAVPFGGLVLDPSLGIWQEAGMWEESHDSEPPQRWISGDLYVVDPSQLVTMLVPDEADAMNMLINAGFTIERIDTP